MPEIVHRIGIKQSPQKVYEAIATVDGLKNWWTIHVDGESKVGESLQFRFPDGGPEMKVIELIPEEFVKWECVNNIGEWQGTIFMFEISPGKEKGDETVLTFAHMGWKDQSPMMAHCNTKWAVFMLSLKDYLEQGKGRPFPDDIHIEERVETD